MTAEEEQLLKTYLGLDGPDFEKWYAGRFADEDADREYQAALSEAQAFEAGWVRAFEDIHSVLDAMDHPAGCGCRPCETIRRVRERFAEQDAMVGRFSAV